MRIFRSILLAALMLSGMTLMAQETSFKGKMVGAKGEMIVLANQAKGLTPVDTVMIAENGEFQFAVKSERPALYVVMLNTPERPMFYIMAVPKEKVTMELVAHPETNQIEMTSVKGSKEMEAYYQFSKVIEKHQMRLHEFNNEYTSAGVTEERKKELRDATMAEMKEQDMEVEQVIRKNKNMLFAAFMVTYFHKVESEKVALYGEVRDALIGKYPDDPMVKNVDGVVKRNIGPGMEAPEIAMKDADGNIRKLSDLRGKVVLIDFWASWCAPCRAEMPNVVRMYQKYHEAGLEIYSVSMDSKRDAWTNAIRNMGMSWENHVSDLQGWTSSGGAAYGVTSIPATFLIDQNGKIIAKNLRGEALGQKLNEIFGF